MKRDSRTDVRREPQNIYDNPQFFAGYRTLRETDSGLNGAVEIPALRALLPNLADKVILDLGCGFGEFARFARQAGAAAVTAVDISRSMLDEAIRQTCDAGIIYERVALEDYIPPARSFDVAVSSLALHYISDLAPVIRRIYAALKPGGQFVFSVEHPIATANPQGWVCNDSGQQLYWPLDRYQAEGLRETFWFVDGVRKYHRTVATYVNSLLAAGFRLEHLAEPGPTAEALLRRPALEVERRRPPFLVLVAVRPGTG